jgi:hypothetical protein
VEQFNSRLATVAAELGVPIRVFSSHLPLRLSAWEIGGNGVF